MIKLLVSLVGLVFRSRAGLAVENLAFRHQLIVLQRSAKRPRLKIRDRRFRVWLSRIWPDWRGQFTNDVSTLGFDLIQVSGDLVAVFNGNNLPCQGDFDNSGDVGVKDLLFLLGVWGPCKGDCVADFDTSGDVGVKDLLVLLGNWGPCP